jgi:hypothetical protein
MDWIERVVSSKMSKMSNEAAMSNAWGREAARLALLSDLSRNPKLGRTKSTQAKHAFQRELDEYIAHCTLGPQRPTWDPDGRESVVYHYSRLLALTVAIEFASGVSAAELAETIREETGGLCQAYFKWCDHILEVWRGPTRPQPYPGSPTPP